MSRIEDHEENRLHQEDVRIVILLARDEEEANILRYRKVTKDTHLVN